MKALAPIRAALGVRTVFNLLGPLTNPAAPRFRLIGAYDAATAELMAGTLAGMEIERAWVVHGAAGWDEATPIGPFLAFDVTRGADSPPSKSIRANSGSRHADPAISPAAMPRPISRRLLDGVRGPRPRSASCRVDVAMRPCAATSPAARIPSRSGSTWRGAAIDSGQALAVAAAACGNSRQAQGSA